MEETKEDELDLEAKEDALAEEDIDQEHPADHIVDDSIKNRLISKNGGTTVVEGKLDLDGNGQPDKGNTTSGKYVFDENNQMVELIYGKDFPYLDEQTQEPTPAKTQTSYTTGYDVVEKKTQENPTGATYLDAEGVAQPEPNNIYPAVAKPDGEYNLKKVEYEAENVQNPVSKAIGRTIAKDPAAQNYDDIKNDYLNVVITIWIEGWQKLENKTPVLDANGDPVLDNENNPTYTSEVSSIWNEDFMNSKFNVGFEFAVDSDENNN